MILRVLIVLALILNGATPAGATGASSAPDGDIHAGAHGPTLEAGHDTPDGKPGDLLSGCCSEPACTCGCAVPQAFSLPVVMASGVWDHARSTFTQPETFHTPGFISAPFRPPA